MNLLDHAAIQPNLEKPCSHYNKVSLDLSPILIITFTPMLFDSLVCPVAEYGCEIWGYVHAEELEVMHRSKIL